MDVISEDQLLEALRGAAGDAVSTDLAERAFCSADIYARGAVPAAVVAPRTIEEAAAAVAATTSHGAAVLPRGGGMSYTGGYIADASASVVFDLRRLDRILAIDAENMVVTVEAGVTWASLNAALKPLGLRTPFWGPLSGISSTIGGGLSQNNALLGGSRYGGSVDSCVGLTVALANGSLVRTGSEAGIGAVPFYRHYGPDLTGLFLGDCGALGVKLAASLRLVRAPAHEGWASFAFADKKGCAAALSEIARQDLAAEAFGFDPAIARIRMKRASLLADLASLGQVVGAQKSLMKGLAEGAKVALAGRSFIDEGAYTLHVVAEGRSRVAVDGDLAEIHRIAKAAGGQEIENTIPKVMRAQPFTPLNNVLGPDGERWVPVHGIVPHSEAHSVWAEIDALFAGMKPRFDAHGVETGYLVTTMSTNGFLIEPVFYWPDERFEIHDATVEPGFLAKMARREANLEARETVAEARQNVIDIFARHGACHFQVGRAYPFAATRRPETLATLVAIKRTLDPRNLMNPGALGLPA